MCQCCYQTSCQGVNVAIHSSDPASARKLFGRGEVPGGGGNTVCVFVGEGGCTKLTFIPPPPPSKPQF